MTQIRVAIGRLAHESHHFHPKITGRDDLTVVNGERILERVRGSNAIIAGMMDVFEGNENVALSAISDMTHPPSGLMDHDFYVEQTQYWCSEIEKLKPHIVGLDLHGAMGTTELDDAEGDFLKRLRDVTGPNTVIGYGLDLHAHISADMLTYGDICIACKENPHTDFAVTGGKIAKLCLETLRGDVEPVHVMAKAKALYPGKLLTTSGPLQAMHKRARAIEREDPTILDISLCNSFRFADAVDMGQAVVVLADGAVDTALAIADDFAYELWDRREEFIEDFLSIEAFLEIVSKRPADALPAVAADMGDRTAAGSPGDSTLVLQAALRHSFPFKAAMTVHDKEVVNAAHHAGAGANLNVMLGGKISHQFTPFAAQCHVKSVHECEPIFKGPVMEGAQAQIGRSAVLVIDGRLTVIVTSKPGRIYDPCIYETLNVPLTDLDFVLAKSSMHFSANFEGIAEPFLLGTPGIGHYVPGAMPRKIEIWPEQQSIETPVSKPEVFRNNGHPNF